MVICWSCVPTVKTRHWPGHSHSWRRKETLFSHTIPMTIHTRPFRLTVIMQFTSCQAQVVEGLSMSGFTETLMTTVWESRLRWASWLEWLQVQRCVLFYGCPSGSAEDQSDSGMITGNPAD